MSTCVSMIWSRLLVSPLISDERLVIDSLGAIRDRVGGDRDDRGSETGIVSRLAGLVIGAADSLRRGRRQRHLARYDGNQRPAAKWPDAPKRSLESSPWPLPVERLRGAFICGKYNQLIAREQCLARRAVTSLPAFFASPCCSAKAGEHLPLCRRIPCGHPQGRRIPYGKTQRRGAYLTPGPSPVPIIHFFRCNAAERSPGISKRAA